MVSSNSFYPCSIAITILARVVFAKSNSFTIVDGENPQVFYDGVWSIDGSQASTVDVGTTATLSFAGTQVSVWGVVDDDDLSHMANFSVDGGDPTMWANTDEAEVTDNGIRYYASPMLSNAQHLVVVTNIGDAFSLSLFNITVADIGPPPPSLPHSPTTSTSTTTPPSSPSPSSPIAFVTFSTCGIIGIQTSIDTSTDVSIQTVASMSRPTLSTASTLPPPPPSTTSISTTSPFASPASSSQMTSATAIAATSQPTGHHSIPIGTLVPIIVACCLALLLVLLLLFLWKRAKDTKARKAISAVPFEGEALPERPTNEATSSLSSEKRARRPRDLSPLWRRLGGPPHPPDINDLSTPSPHSPHSDSGLLLSPPQIPRLSSMSMEALLSGRRRSLVEDSTPMSGDTYRPPSRGETLPSYGGPPAYTRTL